MGLNMGSVSCFTGYMPTLITISHHSENSIIGHSYNSIMRHGDNSIVCHTYNIYNNIYITFIIKKYNILTPIYNIL